MKESDLVFDGCPVSPGYGSGRCFVYQDILRVKTAPQVISGAQLENEFCRIEAALGAVEKSLGETIESVGRMADEKLAAIFEAQRAILKDDRLIDDLRAEMESALLNAEEIVRIVFGRLENRLRALKYGLFSDRGDDVADLARRLIVELTGGRADALSALPEGTVLVAERLLPSDTVRLPGRGISALVVEKGGPASHMAILAREMGLPAVSFVEGITRAVKDGDHALVDAMEGKVILRPSAGCSKSFLERKAAYDRLCEAARSQCGEPAVTPDGRRVKIYANVGTHEDCFLASEYGAEGVGLFRLELLYLRRRSLPGEDELYDELKTSLSPLSHLPLTIRLLDAGSDKQPEYLACPVEPNPALGCRGVRFLLQRPDILDTQLRAVLRIAKEMEVRILVPLVTLPGDMACIRLRVEEISRDLGLSGPPPIGAMIETPAAALCAAELAGLSDFFSIGSNDLAQYTMAAGREDPSVRRYYDDRHPAVMRLMRMVAEEAPDVELSLCGNLAGDETVLDELLDMGIRELSVAPPLIPVLKERVRRLPRRSPLPGSADDPAARFGAGRDGLTGGDRSERAAVGPSDPAADASEGAP